MIQKIYKLHRYLGLLAFLPVLGWCISGLTHPIMAHFFKIKPAHHSYKKAAIELDSNTVSLAKVLAKHNIENFHNFDVITLGNQQYYQITFTKKSPIYVHTKTNTLLEDGDIKYAHHLARYFIDDFDTKIETSTVVTSFNSHYKFINRLLPVHKVSFEGKKGLDVYIHTPSARLGTINDNTRKTCISIFNYLHNWSFLDSVPILQFGLLLFFMFITFLAAGSGLYIYGIVWKKINPNAPKSRTWHRRIGLLVSVSTLAFAFSGGYHAWAKQQQKNKQLPIPQFKAAAIQNFAQLIEKNELSKIKHVHIVRLEENSYFQVYPMDKKAKIRYFNTQTLTELPNGSIDYAKYLAGKYSGLDDSLIDTVSPIDKFEGEYGFINKRLPVMKVVYKNEQNQAVYVEPSSGKLAANISNSKRMEALSFLLLHKYHFLNPLGKTTRDIVIVLIIIGIMLVNILGMILFIKNYKA